MSVIKRSLMEDMIDQERLNEGLLESRVQSTLHARFGGRQLEKYSLKEQLAGCPSYSCNYPITDSSPAKDKVLALGMSIQKYSPPNKQ